MTSTAGQNSPETLQYTAEHEWILVQEKVATIGITPYAAQKLGDVVYVDLPAVGSSITRGTVIGEIESTKSVGELFAPVDGTVSEVNDSVADTPALVNSDPFGDGWLIRIEYSEPPQLLTFDEYTSLTSE